MVRKGEFKNYWTESEMLFLKENKNKMTYSEIASMLNRSVRSVGAKCNRLNLSRNIKNNKIIIEDNIAIIYLENKLGEIVAKCLIDKLEINNITKIGKWSLHNQGYAVAKQGQLLHNYIMQTPKGFIVDHINGNKLDCRKENLRICTLAENNQNIISVKKNNKTGIKGIGYDNQRNKYVAHITVNYKKVFLKYCDTPEEAKLIYSYARAYSAPLSQEASNISKDEVPQWIKDKIDRDKMTIKIESIKSLGVQPTYSIEMKAPYHNYKIGNLISANSHSCSYALIAYQTAYLKANYPVEYMAALLSSVSDKKDKILEYINECFKLNIKILPPDINASGETFSLDGDYVRFGLQAIKGLGDTALSAIMEERKNGPFMSFLDFVERVPKANKTVITALAKCGAFKTLEKSSKYCASIVDAVVEAKKKQGQKQYKDKTFKEVVDIIIEKTIGNPPIMSMDYTEDEVGVFEKDFLGFYVTNHPLLKIKKYEDFLISNSIKDVQDLESGMFVRLIGMVKNIREKVDKKGGLMAFCTLEDLESSVGLTLFAKFYADHQPKENELVQVKGTINNFMGTNSVVVSYIKKIDLKDVLYIDIEDKTYQELTEMQNIFKQNHGFNPVILKYKDKNIITDSDFWVKDPDHVKILLYGNQEKELVK